LRTINGGDDWYVQISGVPSNLLGVKAVSAKRAWAVGLNGIIIQTEDGGRRWLRDASGTTTPLRAIAYNRDGAWAVGRDGVILKYVGKGYGDLRTVFNRR